MDEQTIASAVRRIKEVRRHVPMALVLTEGALAEVKKSRAITARFPGIASSVRDIAGHEVAPMLGEVHFLKPLLPHMLALQYHALHELAKAHGVRELCPNILGEGWRVHYPCIQDFEQLVDHLAEMEFILVLRMSGLGIAHIDIGYCSPLLGAPAD